MNAKKPAPVKEIKILEKNGNSGIRNRIRISTLSMVSSLPISLVFNFTNGFQVN